MVAPPYVAALVGSEPPRRGRGYRIGRNNDQLRFFLCAFAPLRLCVGYKSDDQPMKDAIQFNV